ncbi:MAG: helix-turn-helix domain-containing protein [Halochromatium sp.]
MKITEQIAKNTRIYRANAGLNQGELATKAGISKAYIGKIERGDGNITLNVLSALAKALDVTPGHLISELGLDNAA